MYCIVLSCLVLSCRALSCLALCCLVLSFLVLCWVVLSCFVLCYLVLSRLALSFLVLFCFALLSRNPMHIYPLVSSRMCSFLLLSFHLVSAFHFSSSWLLFSPQTFPADIENGEQAGERRIRSGIVVLGEYIVFDTNDGFCCNNEGVSCLVSSCLVIALFFFLSCLAVVLYWLAVVLSCLISCVCLAFVCLFLSPFVTSFVVFIIALSSRLFNSLGSSSWSLSFRALPFEWWARRPVGYNASGNCKNGVWCRRRSQYGGHVYKDPQRPFFAGGHYVCANPKHNTITLLILLIFFCCVYACSTHSYYIVPMGTIEYPFVVLSCLVFVLRPLVLSCLAFALPCVFLSLLALFCLVLWLSCRAVVSCILVAVFFLVLWFSRFVFSLSFVDGWWCLYCAFVSDLPLACFVRCFTSQVGVSILLCCRP